MASCSTEQWSTKYTPQARLTVVQSSSTDTTATYTWTLEYVAYGYAANVNKTRAWTVTFDGEVIKEGTFDIDGVKNTTTIDTGTLTKTKSTSPRNIAFGVSFVFNLTWTEVYGGTKTASGTIPLAAKTAYTITYMLNGGAGSIPPQTKWYGTDLTLHSMKPTQTGYTFLGWSTSASATTATYSAGGKYTANANAILYAVWKINTWTVTFDANGGSGAPAKQTKTYGVTLTLPSTIPIKQNHAFLGWGTLASSTVVAYSAGGSYTSNSDITLYAIWELSYVQPRITNLSVNRYDSTTSSISDTGTSALVEFDWACDQVVSEIKIDWESATSHPDPKIVPASGTSGHVSTQIGDGSLSTDSTYTVRIFVRDSVDYTKATVTLGGTVFPIDVLAGGKGTSVGKPAELANTFDVNWITYPRGGFINIPLETDTDLNAVLTPNTYVSVNKSADTYLNVPEGISGTFVLEVMSAGAEGQVFQRLTTTFKDENGGHQVFERHYYQGTWGGWMLVQEDTGWVNLSLLNGVTVGSETGYLKGRLKDGVLYIRGDVMNVTATWTFFASLPSILKRRALPLTRFGGVHNMVNWCGMALMSDGRLAVTYNSSNTWDATVNISINVAICL